MHKDIQPYGSNPSRSKMPLIVIAVLFALWFVFLATTAWQRVAQG